MNNKNFSISVLAEQTPTEVYDAILNVRGWWSGLYGEEIKGRTDKLNEEFTFRAGGGVHYSKQKLIELVPYKKIVWLVTDSELTFIEDKSEWTGTKICFDISKKGNKTQIRFTHEGLVPKIECYGGCSGAWTQYVQERLLIWITKDKEQPDKKEK